MLRAAAPKDAFFFSSPYHLSPAKYKTTINCALFQHKGGEELLSGGSMASGRKDFIRSKGKVLVVEPWPRTAPPLPPAAPSPAQLLPQRPAEGGSEVFGGVLGRDQHGEDAVDCWPLSVRGRHSYDDTKVSVWPPIPITRTALCVGAQQHTGYGLMFKDTLLTSCSMQQ